MERSDALRHGTRPGELFSPRLRASACNAVAVKQRLDAIRTRAGATSERSAPSPFPPRLRVKLPAHQRPDARTAAVRYASAASARTAPTTAAAPRRAKRSPRDARRALAR